MMKNAMLAVFCSLLGYALYGQGIISGARAGVPGTTSYVVIAAVADYQYLPKGPGGDLNFTINDAKRFYNFVTSPQGLGVPAAQVALLTDDKATKSGILTALQTTFAKCQEGDQAIFYFSGHGDKGAFIPYDVDPKRAQATVLRHADVRRAFKDCKASTKLCIADACHSESIKGSATEKPDKDNTMANENIAVFMSSRASETSQEFGRLREGVFTYYLIEALAGKADVDNNKQVTLEELFLYVYKNVVNYTNEKQHPVMFGKFDRKLPLVYLQ
jgi:uncharacterized caspase-like protein